VPGTLIIPAGLPAPRIRVMHYSADSLVERNIPRTSEIRPYIQQPGVTWIDVQGLGDERIIREIGEIFSMHPLALEDVVNIPQRPKTVEYPQHQLYVSRMVSLVPTSEPSVQLLDLDQVSIFLGRSYVLTFQEDYGDVLDPVRQRIRTGAQVRRLGPDYLAYAVIDTIIDNYYPVLEYYSERIVSLEDEVLTDAHPERLKDFNQIKRDLLSLRRGIWPQRDAINVLIRDECRLISPEVRVFFRDCYDHCVQLGDSLETYRELAAGLLNTYHSAVSNRTNEIVKMLTIVSSIFIPLTFIVGIYGMNSEHIPELKSRWFYPLILLLMAAIAGGMLLYFRMAGWIGRSGKRRQPRPDRS
jgi:magnesium transporter